MTGGLLQNYLLTLYRTLIRHRLYAALNVFGLAVGIAVFLILWLDVSFETSFDQWIPHAANIYRLDQTVTFPGRPPERTAPISGVVAPLLRADYPFIVAITRLVEDDELMNVENRTEGEQVNFVDPDFFRVLDLPLAWGSSASALEAPGDVVVSERIARKYFGTTSAIGKHLNLSVNGATAAYRVAAVLRDLPQNTHLKLDILTLMTPAFEAANDGPMHDWGELAGPTYVRFRNSRDAQAVREDLLHFVDRRAAGKNGISFGGKPTEILQLGLTPLGRIHFRDATMSFTLLPGVDEKLVASLGAVGLLTLAIAILNYVNLATARSGPRAREVAVRKVLGATRVTLILQFLAEAVAITFLAVLIGLAFAELALPLVNAASGLTLKLRYWGPDGLLLPLLALTLIIGVVAGAYPAMLLSAFQPAAVLAATRNPEGGRSGARVRSGLVVLQFSAAIAFTISTLVLGAQARHLQDADRGFRRDGLILIDGMTPKDLATRQRSILAALSAVPGVSSVTISNEEPASTNIGLTQVERPGALGHPPTMLFETIGSNYLATYGAQLIAGRALDQNHGLDDIADIHGKDLEARGMNIMLNQTAVRALGFATPAGAIGHVLWVNGHKPATVVGVLRDVRFLSPRAPINATFYSYLSHDVQMGVAAVRYRGVPTQAMMARLGAAWRAVVADYPFVAKSAEARLSDYYLPDQRRARLFNAGAALAVAIACLGLYGLASFNTGRRYREIGIRKTLGASTGDILRLLIGQFLRPVLLANLIAWPLAWVAMRGWLAGFDQRIVLGPSYFLAASALTLLVAVATVAGQAWTVARAEPARALRHE